MMQDIIKDLFDTDPDIRAQALDQLGDMRPPNAFDLILLLLKDENEEVRGTAAFNLGDVGDYRAIPLLINLVREDISEVVRRDALYGLGAFKDLEILQVLLEEIDRPKKSRRPRQIVAQQLRHYDTEASVDALVRLLSEDDDNYVRIFAVDSLFKLNRPRLLNYWRELQKDDHDYIRKIAGKAVATL